MYNVTNIYGNIMNPKFIIVQLQNNQTGNQSRYGHVEIKHVCVKINDSWYQDELDNLNTDNGNYALVYRNYYFYRNNEMNLKSKEFMEKCPLYVIDCTKQLPNVLELSPKLS